MTVLASEYIGHELTELLLRLNISNECDLIYTDTVSNLPVFLGKIGKSIGIIIPKTRVKEISSLKVPAYIFISEKLPENALLICKPIKT